MKVTATNVLAFIGLSLSHKGFAITLKLVLIPITLLFLLSTKIASFEPWLSGKNFVTGKSKYTSAPRILQSSAKDFVTSFQSTIPVFGDHIAFKP